MGSLDLDIPEPKVDFAEIRQKYHAAQDSA